MGDDVFRRKFLRVPVDVLSALRAAVVEDSVATVSKVFDALVVEHEGVDIDTTVYAEAKVKSLYYERLDGLHTRGNQCTLLHFAVLNIAPRVARWAVRAKQADTQVVYKIACPAVIPSGTRLRLKMAYAGVAELLAPSAGRYITTSAINKVAEKFVDALKASLTHGDDLDKQEFEVMLAALGVLDNGRN